MPFNSTATTRNQFIAEIARLLEDLSQVDPRRYERASRAELAQLSHEVGGHMQALDDLVTRLANAAENVLEDPLGRRTPRWHCALSVSDMAFVMRMELMAKRRELEAAFEREWIEVLMVCESCLRRLQRALDALHTCLCGETPQLPSLKGVSASLKVRSAYAGLRSQVALLPAIAEDAQAVRKSLRACGTLIAMLVGSDAYPYFRVSDRYQLTQLQRRILKVLGQEMQPRDGVVVFRDFIAFVDLLTIINQRQELRSHDQQQLERWLGELEAAGTELDVQESLQCYRTQLYGLDSGLDRMFEGRTQPAPDGLREHLKRLLSGFGAADRDWRAVGS